MDDISDIWDAYVLRASMIGTEQHRWRSRGEIKKVLYLEQMQKIDDHAYYCLVFAQFDNFIKTRFRNLIAIETATANGSTRAAWKYLKGNKPDFVSMIELLLPDHPLIHERVRELYRDRNRIVHDAKLTLLIELWRIVDDLKYIAELIDTTLPTPEAAP
ncbi:MAG: hypothetical protein WCO00_05380 [Rhodospirillaceae bacterium]